MKENPESRTNLKEYYKKVLICNLCRKNFGSNEDKKHITCPVCSGKLTSRRKL